MKKFIYQNILFFLPLILIASGVELYNRVNNTFYAKAKYVKKYQKSIEVLILGSSQTWRAINPEYMTIKSAPLAHGGSSLNIDYLLFKNFIENLPNLKVVLLETSYHTLDDYRNVEWSKNHLFWIYYGVNNYGSHIPKSDYFLLTANYKEYFKKTWTSSIFPEFGKFNKYGYITTASETLETGHYDSLTLKKRHSFENIQNYNKNKDLLNEIIDICEEKKIDIVFFSPPKYYTYNNYNNINKLARRDSLISFYENRNNIHVWNYEKKWEKDTKIFYNEDHLNTNGSKKITIEIDAKLKKIIKARI
ncbi:hypothetical protein [Psychroflexus planctonicus]|uniref:SGNH/GDSL hydrolase family protein n=1 Tax=Psychroflexus planctonicus TaxID=1526575 RepID=A0ABQ1SDX2_9FLAO|nr:hypothetical protein [Psychroflexus planctonicus]GGE32257.1 hypothetical protein GCM10010832_10670 [Psychroflexus planctonicus]